ncbi:MAG: pyridoxal phosphate-dependent aminotransferase, partial [Candidatus Binatia bacterium]
MTQLCNQHGGVNLAQGFPDFPTPPELKEAAKRAIDEDFNQYSITWGAPSLRKAIAEKARAFNRIPCDADANVTVTCGSTEAMMAALLAIINPGDEVIILEPFYENYGPDVIVSGAKAVYVPLHEPDFTFDPAELRRAFGPRTKAIIVNTPHNPTGRVLTAEELDQIASLCDEFDCYCLTDEIYEHIVYDGREHISIASLPGMAERTVSISGLSKTFSVTGWRVAYAIASEAVTSALRKMHDFLTVGAPHPLQIAGVAALALGEPYYERLRRDYERRRDVLLEGLSAAGFACREPEGAYYVMTDVGKFGFHSDTAFAQWLVREVGVAAVPGSSFYRQGSGERHQIRFTFCKTEETLREAGK